MFRKVQNFVNTLITTILVYNVYRVIRNDAEIVRIFLGLNVKIEDKDDALVKAARNSQKGVVKLLLAVGISVNGINRALIEVAINGHKGITKLLLAANANVDTKDNWGYTALAWAAKYGHRDVVKLLLAAGANVNAEDSIGCTALVRATESGHKKVVKLLLAANANTDSINKALCEAARNGREGIVELLLAAGANINFKDSFGYTALVGAAKYGHTEIIKIFLKVNANINFIDKALIEAARNGKKETIKVLLAAGANVNVEDNFSCTALELAAENGYKDVVELFLNAGASADSIDRALIKAAKNGRKDIVELFLAIGIDVDIEDGFGCTALELAAKNGRKEVVERLLAAGASVSTEDKYGYTALELAVKNGHKEIVEKLLTAGSDVNTESKYGYTILELAADSGREEIIKLFISYGVCKVKIKDCYSEEIKEILKVVEKVSKILANPNFDDIVEEMEKDTIDQLLYKNLFARINNINNLELVLNNQFVKQLRSYSQELDEGKKRELAKKIQDFIVKSIVTGTAIQIEGELDKQSKDYIIKVTIGYILDHGVPSEYFIDLQKYVDCICQANFFIKDEFVNSWQKELESSYQNLVMVLYSIYDNLKKIKDSNYITINDYKLIKMAPQLLITMLSLSRNECGKFKQQENTFAKEESNHDDKVGEYQKNPVMFLSQMFNMIEVFIKTVPQGRIILEPLLDGILKIIRTEKQIADLNSLKNDTVILHKDYSLLRIEKESQESHLEYYQKCKIKENDVELSGEISELSGGISIL